MKTTTLEISKLLKAAGFPQNSDFYYWWPNIGGQYILRRLTRTMPEYSRDCIAAPFAEEVLDELPVYAQFEKHSLPFVLRVAKEIGGDFPDEYVVYYSRQRRIITEKDDYQERGRSTNDSLAEAAAKMYLYLSEKGLLKA